MTRRTLDRASSDLQFLTVEKLGAKQSMTPEGFLLCEEVPVAGIADLLYGPNETPIPVGPNGYVRMHRDEVDVFRPEFMASFAGKPVTINHPMMEVTPDNWKEHAVGTVFNPRRGTGAQADLLLVDMLITDKEGIDAVRSGLREVSCGYEADYDELGPGEGKQYNLRLGNHIALVEAGRCGSRCAISDHQTVKGAGTMKRKTLDKVALMKRRAQLNANIRQAFHAKDAAALEENLKAADEDMEGEEDDPTTEDTEKEEHTHIHVGETKDAVSRQEFEDAMSEMRDSISGLKSTMDSMSEALKEKTDDAEKEAEEAEVEKEAKDAEAKEIAEEADEKVKDAAMTTLDSTCLESAYKEAVALAEILSPGIRIITFDKKAERKKTYDALCHLRRNALDLAYGTVDGRNMIEEVHGKALDLKGMHCRDVKTLFRAAAAMKKVANNGGARDNNRTTAGVQANSKVRTLADLNKQMAEHYKH